MEENKVVKVKTRNNELGIVMISSKPVRHLINQVTGEEVITYSTNNVMMKDKTIVAVFDDDLEEIGEIEDDRTEQITGEN